MKWLTVIGSMIICIFFPALATGALNPPVHPLFDGDAVHEFHLTFHQTNWYDSLAYYFEHFDDIPYMPAEFDWAEVHLDLIGVRFKGLSSYSYPGQKKPFKLDIDEYVDGQEIYGLDKLNLSNGFVDPSFIRERACYELCQAIGLPTVRTNFVALYINGTYWGLYTLVEQFDQEFIESRFGSGEEGNLWKGDPHGTLRYLGAAQEPYYQEYELKTNEEENDWSALIEFVDGLNNTTLAVLPDTMHMLLDVSSALAMLAVNNLTVNLDSYVGRCANYYFYHRDLDSRFVFANWDMNMAWGGYRPFGMSISQMKQLSPYWFQTGPGEGRPLAERLWQIDAYDEVYLGHMQKLMAGASQPDTLIARMEEMRDLIRPYVYADTKKMYTNAQFEAAMTTDISGGMMGTIPGLEPFIRDRDTWLKIQIGTWTPIQGLVLNELMASNDTTAADDHGDYDDWIEVANLGTSPVSLGGLWLTDHMEGQPDYVFPDTTLAPGEYIVVWADEEPEQGQFHAPFKLDADGEDVYLVDGAVIVDQVTFPDLGTDVCWGRWPNGSGEWQLLSQATPGAENQNPEEPQEVVLYINEFLALNESVIQDEADEYEDWVEIYNPGPDPVEMGGLFLTDDLANTTQWSFPDTTLEAGGFLLVWCDNDEGDGPLHATFKLSGDGEAIGLFNTLVAGNEEIDSYTFGAQTDDVSEGRETDGGETWIFFSVPTPGASNSGETNMPPVISGTSHTPLEPTPSDTVTVTSTVTDESGIASVLLKYDAGSGYQDVTMFDDGNHGDGAAGDDVYGGFIPPQVDQTTVSYYLQAEDDSSAVITDPADAPTSTYSYTVGYIRPSIFINEFMADNDNVVQDEVGDYDDWLELYNAGDEAVNLEGMYLTDDLADPTQWQIPDTTIPAGGFLLFWADDEEGEGPLHTNFKLGAGGEELGLFDTDANANLAIDTLTFGEQTTDISYGRYPDGEDFWMFFSYATPGSSNVAGINFPPVISGTSHDPSQPTPSDTVTVTATVTDESALSSVLLRYDAGTGYQDVSMFDDGNHGDGAVDDDVYGGFIPPQADQTVVNYYLQAEDDSTAVTTDPADAPTSTYSYTVGYFLPPILINEFMADNDNVAQDEAGDYDDWLELYNAGDEPVNLGGMYLTDDLADPTQWQIPDTTIEPGGFLVFWADDEEGEGPLHTNFKLGAGGEELGLFSDDLSSNLPLDSLTFGEQTVDTSFGRCSDGSEEWTFFRWSDASPGERNFVRGDANGDCMLELGDAIYVLNYLFKGGESPDPPQSGNANCDEVIDLGDAILLLNYLFKGGPPPGC